MNRLARLLALTLALALAPTLAHGAGAESTLPGVPLPLSVSTVMSSADPERVYSVWLNRGESISAQLTVGSDATSGFDPVLLLYGPGTTSLLQDEIVASQPSGFPKTLGHTAQRAGQYYLNIHQSALVPTPESGVAVVSWKVVSPVYRFYNAGQGTHFYTPSFEERSMVTAVYSNVFQYENIAYYTQPYVNQQPLYRFYNRRSNSHFYTADSGEAATVRVRWPDVYADEGETYRVSRTGPASAAVYRFYNMQNGSHFFTADAGEAQTVRTSWPHVYRDEGVAFYTNP